MSQLGRTRTTRILLPAAYYKYPEKRLPVLYMMDGQNLFDTNSSFGRPWYLQHYMDQLPLRDQVIIVGIDHGAHLRKKEYLPFQKNKLTVGEADGFIDFIIHDLKPKVDSHIRTLSSQEHTMISGSSMGGLLTFYAATRYSHIFGKAGVLSPSFWADPTILHFEPIHKSQMYIAGSATESKDMAQTLQHTYWTMKHKGYSDEDIKVTIKNRGKHNEIFWGRQFGPMLQWLMSHHHIKTNSQ